MDCLGYVSITFLIIINCILMAGGIITLIRGLYLRLAANELSKHFEYRITHMDDMTKRVSYLFIVPGVIMFITSYFGCCGAMNLSKYQLVIYCIIMLILACTNIYYAYVISDIPTSMLSYLVNNVFTTGVDTNLQQGNPYGDTAVQVLALLSAIYLIFQIYRTTRAKNTFVSVNYDE